MGFNFLIPLTVVYTTIIVILVWARYRYFSKVDEGTIWRGRWIYDPVAFLHISLSFYLFFTTPGINLYAALTCFTLYVLGTILFFWSMRSGTNLKFASSNLGDQLVTSGPYRFIRHPLYLSYTLIWIASCVLFNSLLLWITLIALVTFYIVSAKREEAAIMNSEHSIKYKAYKNSVGMFLPRVTKWKKLNLKRSMSHKK